MSLPRLTIDPAREELELRKYLGSRFELDRLQHYRQQLDAEFASIGDEDVFYRTSNGYLYDLTAFAMSATKLPYLNKLVDHLSVGARVLDYGCGIGSDGLLLLEAGYHVEFADFDNPSSRYLRWRLQARGLEAPVHDLDVGVPGGYDAAYSFDVIEHVQDPFAFLAELESRARIVEVNFLEPAPDEPAAHHELPIPALLKHAAQQRLCSYRVHHGRSHLVVYETRPGGRLVRLRNRARLFASRPRRS